MRKHRVTFISPGTFFEEKETLEIPSWDVELAVAMSSKIGAAHGAKPFAFQFSTSLCADPVPDGEGGTLTVQSRMIEESGLYYLGGKIFTAAEIIAADPKNGEDIADNMRSRELDSVIANLGEAADDNYRWTQPWKEGCCLVDKTGQIVRRWEPAEKTYPLVVGTAKEVT